MAQNSQLLHVCPNVPIPFLKAHLIPSSALVQWPETPVIKRPGRAKHFMDAATLNCFFGTKDPSFSPQWSYAVGDKGFPQCCHRNFMIFLSVLGFLLLQTPLSSMRSPQV